MKICCLVLLAGTFIPGQVFAQDRELPPQRLIISDRAVALSLAEHPPARQPQQRDSIKNGTFIGMAIGAVAMGSFVGWLCHQLREPNDPSCWKSVAYAGALGAGAGALAGAGVDAIASRAPFPRPSAALSPEAPAAGVAPIRPGRRQ